MNSREDQRQATPIICGAAHAQRVTKKKMDIKPETCSKDERKS